MLAYQTTPRATIGETPFSLTYGFEAIVPTEISLATYRVASYDDQLNEEVLRVALDLVDEKRDEAYLHMVAFKQRVS